MTIDLRPMSVGELLDRTFSLYRKRFLLFVGIMAIPQLFALAASLAAQAMQITPAASADPNNPGGVFPAAYAVVFLLGYLLMLIVYIGTLAVGQAATVFAVSELHLGRTTTVREAYARVRGRLWRLLDVIISTGLRIVAGLMLLIIPGILLMLRYALAIPCAVLENVKAKEAIKRSAVLTKGSWGRIFLVILLFWILSWTAAAVLQFPFLFAGGLFAQQGQPAYWLVTLSHLGGFVAGVLAGPFLTIAFSLLYYDERVRKEAFDLQMMMSALDQSSTGTSAPRTPEG